MTELLIKCVMVGLLLGSSGYQFHCAGLCEGPELDQARSLTRLFGTLFLVCCYFILTWRLE